MSKKILRVQGVRNSNRKHARRGAKRALALYAGLAVAGMFMPSAGG